MRCKREDFLITLCHKKGRPFLLTKHTAGSTRSGSVKRCRLGHAQNPGINQPDPTQPPTSSDCYSELVRRLLGTIGQVIDRLPGSCRLLSSGLALCDDVCARTQRCASWQPNTIRHLRSRTNKGVRSNGGVIANLYSMFDHATGTDESVTPKPGPDTDSSTYANFRAGL